MKLLLTHLHYLYSLITGDDSGWVFQQDRIGEVSRYIQEGSVAQKNLITFSESYVIISSEILLSFVIGFVSKLKT